MALDTIPKQEGGKLKAVASGTLPNGKPVVVNADGTVSVAGINTVTETVGTAVVFESATSDNISAAYDANAQKVVVAYRDQGNSNYGAAVVGTISGTSVSFGTPVVFSDTNTRYTSICFDENAQKMVIAYGFGLSGRAIVGTVSGTSISFGSPASLGTNAQDLSIVYDSSAQKVVVSLKSSNDNYGYATVGTVSGTSISFGTLTVFASHNIYETKIAYDSTNNKVVIAYTNASDGQKGTAIVGTVSGTSISFGSAVVFDAGEIAFLDVAYDVASGKSVIVYMKGPGGNQGANAIVGTISGTSISFGTAVVYDSGSGNENNTIVYHEAAEKVIVVYWDNSNSDRATALTGTVSGTSISFENSVVLEQGASSFISPAYDSTNEVVFVALKDDGNSGHGTGVVYQPAYSATNLTSENYIGMSQGYTDRVSQGVGSESVFESASVIDLSATYDANAQKVVVAYTDNGNSRYGTAVVGTVSGKSITFGTPVVFESANTEDHTPVYDSNAQKIVIGYQDRGNSDYGTAIVGTVSGTSISFGSPQVFHSGTVTQLSGAFDSNNNKVVFAYSVNNSNGNAVVGTVSGTSISFGSTAVFESGSTSYTSTVYDTNAQKIVISYVDGGDSFKGKSVVATVSGTTISYGSLTTFNNASTGFVGSVYDPDSQKVIVTYADNGNSSHGTAIVGTVSGTSISFGSEIVFNAASTQYTSATYDEGQNKLVVAYRDVGNSNSGTVIPGTVSGSSITFGDETVFNGSESNFVTAVYDAASGNSVISYIDNGNSNYGTSVVFQNAYDNSGSVADGDNATVDIIGSLSTNQGGLTAGQQYYVQTDGTVGTTPADPSVLAGTAVSATKMVVKS
jgi:hypothetical protein